MHGWIVNREMNLISLTNPWLTDGYCSITVANYGLIRLIIFISWFTTHPCKKFCKYILFNISCMCPNIRCEVFRCKILGSKHSLSFRWMRLWNTVQSLQEVFIKQDIIINFTYPGRDRHSTVRYVMYHRYCSLLSPQIYHN